LEVNIIFPNKKSLKYYNIVFKLKILNKLKIKIKYKNTTRLIKGKKVKTFSNAPSIIVFSIHKSASTFLNILIRMLSDASGLIRIDPASYFAYNQEDVKKKLLSKKVLNNLFRTKGFIYGPIRWNIAIQNIEKYKILLILRDPRDVLVSYYYSMRYSHVVIHNDILQERELASKMTIDEYVLYVVNEFLIVYRDYMKIFNLSNVKFIKYEDMINNPQQFLKDVQNFLNINLNEEDYQKCLRELTPNIGKEDVFKHKRSGKTKQFIEKLEKDTVKRLNTILHDVIEYYGFEK